jgi:hypothetical protein
MRRATSVLLIAAFACACALGGCLSSIIPEHHSATTEDAGVAQDGGADLALPAGDAATASDGGP